MGTLTGDTLAISLLFWSAMITPVVQMVQEVRAKNLRWAAIYAAGALFLLSLGFGWPFISELIAHPPHVATAQIFTFGVVLTAVFYTFVMKPRNTGLLGQSSMVIFFEGLSVVPLITVAAIPFAPFAVIGLLRDQGVLLAGASVTGVLSIVSASLQRHACQDV